LNAVVGLSKALCQHSVGFDVGKLQESSGRDLPRVFGSNIASRQGARNFD
jgi:hypothetical protein